jgi:DNA polymerase-3 subunit alpha
VKADVSLAELQTCKDGDWVTVGGIITTLKKMRTRNGDPMAFATLDDLEGCVELAVFSNALASCGDGLEIDSVVLIRGRIDHKDKDKTSIVVQSVEPFAPTEDEVIRAREEFAKMQLGPEPFRLPPLDAGRLPATFIDELKEILGNFPGESDVVLEVVTSGGRRTLKLGSSFRVANNASLRAEVQHMVGSAALARAEAEAATQAA